VASYLVERYLPGRSVVDIQAAITRLETVAQEMVEEGVTVRYLGSAFIPSEEACFCQFEGPSPESVAEANVRAGFPFARILSLLRLGAAGSHA
jgi:hypothetical protein